MFDKDFLRRRLAFIREGSELRRFHTKRTLQENNIGYHSYHVACLVMLMAPGVPLERLGAMLRAALVHDLAEHRTGGDISGDAKREMGIREIVNAHEARYMADMGFDFENLLEPSEKRLLKLADMLDGALFCISEASLGNRRMGSTFDNYRSYIALLQPTGPVEEAIVEYIDELWSAYELHLWREGK